MSVSEKSLDQYFTEAGEWGYDRFHALRRRTRYLWVGLVFSWLITLAAILAVYGLTPLKENTPFLIERNAQTGEVTPVERVTESTFEGDWLVDQSYIYKYFKARERFISKDRFQNEDYLMVQILSSNEASKRYKDFIDHSADSPKQLFSEGDTRSLHIKALVQLPDGAIQIHWSSEDYIDGLRQPRKHWISTLQYGYSKEAIPKKEKYKYENLLGFMVTSYQREAASITGLE